MAKGSIQHRLTKLEAKRRFLEWFVRRRFYQTLTEQELVTFAVDGQLPASLSSRPTAIDTLDRETINRLWKEDDRIFGNRTQEELAFFATNGFWPEQTGRFHYSVRDGKLIIEWQNEAADKK